MTHEVVEELADELGLLPVRTEILNIDTGETGRHEVALPLGLRDRILTALRTNPPATGEVGELVERLTNSIREIDDNPADTIGAPYCMHEARVALTSQAAEIARLQAQVDAVRAEQREIVPYTSEEIEVFQRAMERGVWGVDDMLTGTRDERIDRARAALSGSNSDAG
jgi:hypothetical protein